MTLIIAFVFSVCIGAWIGHQYNMKLKRKDKIIKRLVACCKLTEALLMIPTIQNHPSLGGGSRYVLFRVQVELKELNEQVGTTQVETRET